jgi:hypothetical protein
VNSDLNNDGNNRTDRAPNEARDAFRLPANYSLDPRITKTMKFGERARMQLTMDAFNVFNHFNVTGVNTAEWSLTGLPGSQVLRPVNTGAAAFGVPTAHAGARILQLGLKVSF